MTDTSVPDWATEAALLNTWHQMASRQATAARRKPARGIDGLSAEAFELRKHFHCSEISRILCRSDKKNAAPSIYRFAPLIEQEREAEPGKLRRIYIPRIRDQIVIRSLYRTLSTAMQKNGLRGGLENPQAVARRVIYSRQNGRRYVARFDIRGFYDAIAHPLLLVENRAAVAQPDKERNAGPQQYPKRKQQYVGQY